MNAPHFVAAVAALALALASVVATGCSSPNGGAAAPMSGYSSHGSGSGY